VVGQRNDFGYSDHDLTIDKFDSEPLDPSVVDLFDYLGDDSSPIGRLKALVLSIDWEITDQVLCDFNEELVSLRDIWGGDPIKVVYLQALEKISKYIYRTQSEAHPDAIKLLPILFVDLEKLVQAGKKMSEEEKKQLLIEDVRRFERLKAQILERHRGEFVASHEPAQAVQQATSGAVDHEGVMAINRLKALILGIDWEITEKDLMALRREVLHLEGIFAHSRPKQLFLQGIGTLSAYIRNKKSNAHADAFSLLHDFFGGLEQVVTERLAFPAEKAVLLPLVARFNAFKETIAATLSAEAIAKSKQAVLEEEAREEEEAGPLLPAFADVPEDVHGFHIEEEALSSDVPRAVITDIEKFFTEEDDPPLVRIGDAVKSHGLGKGVENPLDQPAAADPTAVAPEVALRGIHVETEADDDSGETALPRQGGQLAPALSDEPVFPYSYGEAGAMNQTPAADSEIPEEINNRLDNFFSTPTPTAPPPTPLSSSMKKTERATLAAPSGVGLPGSEVAADIDKDEDAPAAFADWHEASKKEPTPALADADVPELKLEESEPEVEFAPVFKSGSTHLLDDEAEELEDGESGEIMPALSGLDDADLPERSEFAEEDDTAATVEDKELLAFFQDEAPAAKKKASFPLEAKKPETLVVDELELFETSVPDKNAEPVLSLDDEADLTFIDDFFADKSNPPPASAKSVTGQPGAPKMVGVDAPGQEEGLLADVEFPGGPAPLVEDVSLRECVNALADEINDDILDQAYRQIRLLRAELGNQPLVETYLQFISAIMQHIDQRRAGASAEALPLLRQMLAHLEESQRQGGSEHIQRFLLDDVQTVLSWQQSLLQKDVPGARPWL